MKIAICTLIKDEHPYLKDWIDYHLALGFTDIYLLEDDGSESHWDLIKKYPEVHFRALKDYVDSTAVNRQIQAFRRFLRDHKNDVDWVLFSDIDEYLRLAPGLKLEETLKDYSDFPGVVLAWRIIGASGDPIDLSGKAFLKRHTKYIVQPSHEPTLRNPHFMVNGVDTLGRVTSEGVPPEGRYSKIWLDHYYTRTWEEWTRKLLKRGDLEPGHRKLGEFFELHPEAPKEELVKKAILEYGPRKVLTELLEPKEAILMVTTEWSPGILERFNRLTLESPGRDCWLLLQAQEKPKDIPEWIKCLQVSTEELFRVGYKSIFPEKKLLPGNCHWTILWFWLRNRGVYKNIWFLEDDVYYKGYWGYLWRHFFEVSEADFLTSHLEYYSSLENSSWPWWTTGNTLEIPLREQMKGFNPICRYSDRALRVLHETLLNEQPQGHSEVLITTILKTKGLILDDLYPFYHKEPGINNGSIRWRPLVTEEEIQKDPHESILWHPLKIK